MADARGSCSRIVNVEIVMPSISCKRLTGHRLVEGFGRPHRGFFSGTNPYVGWAENWYYDVERSLLMDSKGCIIRESVNASVRPPAAVEDRRERLNSAGVISGPATVLRTQRENFYHTMVDNLPRMFLLETAGLGGELDILVPEPMNPAEEYWLPRLMPQGARIRRINGTPACRRIENLVYASPFTTRFRGVLPRKYTAKLHDAAYGGTAKPRARRRRLLISRSEAAIGGRRILNEDELLEALFPWRFERCILENISIPEQVKLFRNAEMIVGAHGAGLANMLFLEEKAAILELFPGNYIIPHYFFLAESLGMEYHFAFPMENRGQSMTSSKTDRNSDFATDIDTVLRHVRTILD